jgi:hypothetical protein
MPNDYRKFSTITSSEIELMAGDDAEPSAARGAPRVRSVPRCVANPLSLQGLLPTSAYVHRCRTNKITKTILSKYE